MKLLRYGEIGKEKPGILDKEGNIRDLSGLIDDFESKKFEQNFLEILKGLDINYLPKVKGRQRLGVPFNGIGKIICVGLNYADHAKEAGVTIPQEPVLFLKTTSSITGPNDDVKIPRKSNKTDWEVELGVVIGKKASYVSPQNASKHIAGYVLINDVSEREFQLERQGQWDKGKGCDTFSPIGPWLVTPDEITEPHNLKMTLSVNGKKVQNSNTNQMIFKVPFLISYISQFMSLHAGDVISTGTPPGVGLGQKPHAWYLKKNDVMELSIQGLGSQKQRCILA